MEKLRNCRVCGCSELKDVLDLGEIYPSAFLKEDEKVSEDSKVSLALVECENCKLVQLKYTVELDQMYRQYWYASSLNKSMVSSLKNIVEEVESRVELTPEDTVTDIGCNDGTLLGLYTKELFNKVGFEPALNIRPKENTVITWIPEYFTKEYWDLYHKHPTHPEWANAKSKVITAIAMFYDLPDPNKFVKDVKAILHPEGIFVVQFTDLLSMFKACAFDNICHEHLEYYKLRDVVTLLRDNGLRVIDVSYNDVNGGSVRVTATHWDSPIETPNRVQEAILAEEIYFRNYTMEDFKLSISFARSDLEHFLSVTKLRGEKVFLLGASTKGNTLLQVCEVNKDYVPYAAEVNKDKFGLRTVGTNIEIISEEEAFSKNPDYFLVPVWHFESNLLTKSAIREYIKRGGKLVFPLPVFHIVGKEQLHD